MYTENGSLGFIEAVHLVVKKRCHTTKCMSEAQFANERINDP